MSEPFKLSDLSIELMKKELTRYETKRSALIPCLYQIQKEKGYISPEAVSWLSKFSDLPESHVQEVLSFYTLFNKKPVGRTHIQVCCNVSCSMYGAKDIVEQLCKLFKIKEGEVSEDDEVSISRAECLGACDQAPVIQIEEKYIGKLSPEKSCAEVIRLTKK